MTENTPPKAEATLRPPKVIQTQATPETDVSTPWKASPLVDENVTFSETSCSSTTLSHEDGATLPPKLALNSSNRALFQDSPVARSSEQELAVYPPCCTTLPERRVERYPTRRTERHASSRQLRSRRLSQTSSFYSSDEDEQPRRRSTTRRRRRSSKEDHSFRNQVLRFSRTRSFQWILTIMGLTSVSMTFLAGHSLMQNDLEHPQRIEVLFRQLEGEADEEEEVESETTPVTAADHRFAGLRGNMLHDVVIDMEKKTPSRLKPSNEDPKQSKHHHHHHGVGSKSHSNGHKIAIKIQGGVAVPAKKLHGVKPLAEPQDGRFYPDAPVAVEESLRRVVALEGSPEATQYQLDVYPSPFTDNTQLYSLLDSSDERLHTMELREPLDDGECVPMQEWQTTFHPSCNAMHEMDMASMGQKNGDFFSLFGTKGYWRNAWRVDAVSGLPQTGEVDTIVLKTLKIEHRFEEAHFEHDRVDAVAMERLTASPHVINIFGYCGHSVMTEYADGKRLGELADKSRKKPLARLRIARNIAEGLADLHGIDGDGNTTLVHLDVNPANVVSVQGTLKLNDFNIGILRRWNTTSNEPCGFPAQYPNPQWRSPEEARNEQHLTEKVDVFSMGHIFFRLICGHEPWHKLEPGGRPAKEVVTRKVVDGVLPFIPDEVIHSTDAEVVAIREAMLKCYTYDPHERPSAREITSALQAALDELEKTAQI